MVRSHSACRRTAIVLFLASVGLACGCVERRYTIRTDPPGAQVIVNGESLGPAPASHNFYYYGDREITLILDGYETKTLIQPINAPWWDNYLTEFFSENMVPWVIRDEQEFTYKLEPARVPTQDEVTSRADALRSEAQILPPPRRGGILGFFGF
ncbi:MAG: PEGA domain-containing protein [Planctomycetota bacterium]|nr:PEGA domain-containing protein [Planctomycetota bacterium]